MFTLRVVVIKMSEMTDFSFFSADESQELVTVWAKYLCVSERYY